MAVRDRQPGIMRTNSVEQSSADTDEPDTKLRKDLGTWDLIGVGAVFGVVFRAGAGIVTPTASTAGDVAGPSVSLAFVLAAVPCGLAALCYAEFASTVPVAQFPMRHPRAGDDPRRRRGRGPSPRSSRRATWNRWWTSPPCSCPSRSGR